MKNLIITLAIIALSWRVARADEMEIEWVKNENNPLYQ